MKSIGKCLSERYVLNGIIESRFRDVQILLERYAYSEISGTFILI